MDFSLKKVLITDPVDSSCIKTLQNNNISVQYKPKLPVAEILNEIKDADGLIVRSGTTVTAEIINAAKKLKIIGRAGVGVDNIDCTAATQNGVVVINAPGGNTLSAAELTCAMILSLARHVPQGCFSLKEGNWDRAKFMGSELSDKTLAIIGLGRIGREVAKRMQSFGMKTIGYDPLVSAEESETFGIHWLPIDEIWPQADFITLHVPLIPQTKNLIDKAVLAKCRKGVCFINVARGGIIDEEALYASLETGQCGGFGVDVYIEEPPKDFTLIKHPKVICTPHLGASTKEAQVKVAEEIADQFVAFVQGKQIHGAVNAPSLNEAMKEEKKPWALLARTLGRLASNIKPVGSKQPVTLTLHKYGKSLENDGNLLMASVLVGVLEKKVPHGINLVNAPVLASAAGIKVVTQIHSERLFNSQPCIKLEIVSEGDSHVLEGGVSGFLPLLFSIDSASFPGGIPLRGHVLLFKSAATDRSLPSLIEAVSALNIPVTSASESSSFTQESKWYLISLQQVIDFPEKLQLRSANFVGQIAVD